MKNSIALLVLIVSTSGFANTIEGTLVLKGTVKTQVMVNSVSTTCKAQVEKIKNLLEEDYWGNPGYQVRIQVSLDGNDSKRKIKIKSDRDYNLTNMFVENGRSMAKDLKYASTDGALMGINREGRLESVTIPYGTQLITCSF